MKKLFSTKWGMLLTILIAAVVCKLTGRLDALAALPFVLTVEAVAGYPDFTAATGSGKIPNLFARKAIVKFYDESVMPKNLGRINAS